MFGIREKVAQTARRAGLLSGGLLLCTVGFGFLTTAAWFALLPTVGITVTALIVGAAYAGIGLILIGVGSVQTKGHRPAQPQQAADAPDSPPIVQAFMYGLQAGTQADRARH
ncbi:phage holin family protein [uncultured Tateyamaria sp.]|uniref:phage holin family protein n=1 Tax=uncultured Tateyamaria sp. TaxID=455651 RepID=UPI0034568435